MMLRKDEARTILYLHEIKPTEVQADVERYLEEELEFMSPLKENVQQLAILSGCFFIYAATAIRYIRPGRRSPNPQRRLREVLAAKPSSKIRYAGLDTLYLTILNSAFDEKELEAVELENIRLSLNTVVCAKEPIPLQTLSSLTGIVLEDVLASLEPLRSVLHVSESTGMISIFHASFPEFMFHKERSERFHCVESIHGDFLTRQCFSIMKSQLRFNICHLENSFILDQEVEDLETRVEKYISEPLLYACQYWAEHLASAKPSNVINVLLRDFLRDHLLFWLEVLNLTGSVPTGMGGLQKARYWLLQNKGPKDDARSILRAQKFVSVFSSYDVSLGTPHIYISMLPFFCTQSDSFPSLARCPTQGLLSIRGSATHQIQFNALAGWNTGGSVYCIALSPDGTSIAFGGDNGRVGLLDQASGRYIGGSFARHTESVHAVAYSPDGTQFATGSADHTICLWNAQCGTLAIPAFKGHGGPVYSVKFSPTGRQLASGSYDTSICYWDTEGGALLKSLRGHTASVDTVAFSYSGTMLASGARDKTVRLWDIEQGVTISVFQGHERQVSAVAFSPDDAKVASSSYDKTVRFWDTITKTQANAPPTIEGHTDAIFSLAFSPNGHYIASGSKDTTVRIWNTSNGAPVAPPFEGHSGVVYSLQFSHDGTCVTSGSTDSTIRMWDVEEALETDKPPSAKGNFRFINSVSFSPDGTYIASGSDDLDVRLWYTKDGQPARVPFQGHTSFVNSVAFSPDCEFIVSGSADHTVRVWKIRGGAEEPLIFDGHTGPVFTAAFSPDGSLIASGSHDHTIRLWEVKNGSSKLLRGHTGSVNSIAFSSDGKLLASGSGDNLVGIWNIKKTGRGIVKLRGHTCPVTSVAFSSDNLLIVSGSFDKTIRVWSALDETQLGNPLHGHEGFINSVAFSPDCVHVASGSHDTTIMVWDVYKGTLAAGPFRGHDGYVFSVAFSPDGTKIVSGSSDSTIRVIQFTDHGDPASFFSDPWEIDYSGWVVNAEGHHLFWVPPEYRHILPRAYNPFTICPQGTLQINYHDRELYLGECWHKCISENHVDK
ncbi:hypothetical protein FRC11_009095 [Ceratobasidium sp. 423]|nr:hypothetical protein FRC11_009095 [Ceratobasidium sp. 423]